MLSGSGHGIAYSVLLLAALGFVLAFAATGVLRAIFPYPIDGLEPGALQEVNRVLAGQPLYVAPALDYVPQIYAPALFYLAAPLAALSGSSQFGLRATSLLASLGSIGLLVLLIRRETGHLGMGLFAGALLAACDQLVDGSMDIGRTDAVALFFLLAATYATHQAAFQPRATWRSGAIGGCLLGLALLSKQSGLPVALALVAVLAAIRHRQLLPLVAAAVLTSAAGLGLLVLQSGSWPLFYLCSSDLAMPPIGRLMLNARDFL